MFALQTYGLRVYNLGTMKNVDRLLNRGTDTIYPSREFLEKKLASDEVLTIYWGVDPTGEMQLHHAIPLFKLRHFQELGHRVIILIGSFTAMIGDPTGKTKTRIPLTKDQIVINAKNYAKYAAKILDFDNNPPQVVFNGDWLEKLSFKEVIELASHFTVQQMLERDMFQDRLKNNLPIGLHEFLYPLMQGYDSVALNTDGEIGGSDQTFNMLAGRKLVEAYNGKEKIVLTVPLLTDASGKKMSTSDGSGIALNATATDMFGKIMSLPDDFILGMFVQCTEVADEGIAVIKMALDTGANPMGYKKQLALDIVSRFHGDEAGNEAQNNFESTVQNDELPDDMPEWKMDAGLQEISELIFSVGLVESKGDAKRMIQQNAVSIYENGEEKKIPDPRTFVEVKDGMIIRVGKRRFIKLKVGN